LSVAVRIGVVAAAAIAVAACRPQPSPLPLLSEMREFVVPWSNSFPSDIVTDSTGRVWFTDRLAHRIGMFDPSTEQFTPYEIPTRASTPYGITAAPDGSLWFAESQVGRIGRIDPRNGAITEFVVAPDQRGGPHTLEWRDGAIWFTLREATSYGRFDPATGRSVIYKLAREKPYGIAITRDTVWLGTYTFTLIAVEPQTGTAHHHALLDAVQIPARDSVLPRAVRGGELRRIAADASGILWLSDRTQSRVLRYDPRSGTVGIVPTGGGPYGITTTRAGHVWWGETSTSRVVVYDPVSGQRAFVQAPTRGGYIRDVFVDERRGRVWLPLSDVGRIGLVVMQKKK
jgi:virginiamycin B lyase